MNVKKLVSLGLASAVILSSYPLQAAQAADNPEPDNGLLAHYDMSKANGKLVDLTGHGLDAEYAGFQDSDFLDENQDKLLNFTGDKNKYVKLPRGLITDETFTIEAKFSTATGANHWLYTLGTTPGSWPNVNNYVFLNPMQSNGTVRFGIKNASTELLFQGAMIQPGELNTYTATFEAGLISFYLNGSLVGSLPHTYSVMDILAKGTNAADNFIGYLGKSLYNPDPAFIGKLADFKVYDNALSAEEVKEQYDSGDEGETPADGPYTGNPIIKDRFSADPSAMVHDGKVYLYAGRDTAAVGANGYNMPNWDIYTSTDMKSWKLEGSVPRTIFTWAQGNSAWAAQTIERDGKFYWYTTVENSNGSGMALGVAVSDDPVTGWKDAIGKPLVSTDMTANPSNMGGYAWDDIDPTVFIDKDGQAYLYWGNTHLYYAKLKANMIELDGEIHKVDIAGMPGTYTEAPWLHQYKDKYYLSFAMNWPEDIAYAVSDSPAGPWTYGGKIMEETEGTGTNHQAIIEFNSEWYFIHHTAALPTGGDYRRSVSIEKLNYNPDGSIQPMIPTASGIHGSPELLQVSGDSGFIYHENGKVGTASQGTSAAKFEWFIAPGLANEGSEYVSIQAENRPGYYWRRSGNNIVLEKNDGTTSFKEQATFKKVAGLGDQQQFSLQAYADEQLYVMQTGNRAFAAAAPATTEEKARATFRFGDGRVDGVTLDIESDTIKAGSQVVLTAKVTPDEALIKDVEFISSNSNVLSVNGDSYLTPDGEVRVLLDAKAAGTADITAKTKEGNITSRITLTVIEGTATPSQVKDVQATFNSAQKQITIAGTLDKGAGRKVTVRIVNSDGTTRLIESTTTGSNGKFILNYPFNPVVNGEYRIELYEQDLPEPYQTDLTIRQVTAHYDFDGDLNELTGNFGSGSITGDRINNQGGTIAYGEGITGQAAAFDGTSGILLPNGLIDSSAYSVSLWLNPAEFTSFTTTFFGASSTSQWVSVVPSGNQSDTLVWSGNSTWYDASTGMRLEQNKWSHVAFTVDNGAIKVYVNGEEKFSGTNFPNVFAAANAVFGLGVNYWDTPFQGLMDDLRIYNNAVLSGAEIRNLYDQALNPTVPASAQLTGPEAVSSGQSFDVAYKLAGDVQESVAQDIIIQYDADKLTFVSAESLQEHFLLAGQQESQGQIRILATRVGDVNLSEDLLNLKFAAKGSGSGGDADITVTSVVTANADGAESTLPGGTHRVTINEVNRAALLQLIEEAQQFHNAAAEGTAVGQYPVGSKATLQTAISTASAVAEQADATQAEIEQATETLQAALQAFKSSVIKPAAGDINNDGRYSIGDLGIIAAAYGKTSADADWSLYGKADLNNDGIVDIKDLVTAARLILG
ncbi:hypothetical protein FHS18_005823 [Paenibacillus phyllosphaerae]|uniref:Dockerin domain-containing protein n=1 Tax=Paenibacillus phyllosphaerae TaxID=274593 RepID=A0A7W5FQQ4_9BACL|nr:LamG-like jellyroll fold domain-containing protein [Paenibacillus phyllosphaerae]MBB3113710.1 hypothetical protein [Paenibacillus phyllosphaerae]